MKADTTTRKTQAALDALAKLAESAPVSASPSPETEHDEGALRAKLDAIRKKIYAHANKLATVVPYLMEELVAFAKKAPNPSDRVQATETVTEEITGALYAIALSAPDMSGMRLRNALAAARKMNDARGVPYSAYLPASKATVENPEKTAYSQFLRDRLLRDRPKTGDADLKQRVSAAMSELASLVAEGGQDAFREGVIEAASLGDRVLKADMETAAKIIAEAETTRPAPPPKMSEAALAEIHKVEPRKPATKRIRELPQLPTGLAWPTETYTEASKGGENIIEFLTRVWLPLIKAGVAERRLVADLDPSVIDGIKSYTRKNRTSGKKRTLPKHLRFLTVSEVITHRVATDPVAALQDRSTVGAIAGRLYRATPK